VYSRHWTLAYTLVLLTFGHPAVFVPLLCSTPPLVASHPKPSRSNHTRSQHDLHQPTDTTTYTTYTRCYNHRSSSSFSSSSGSTDGRTFYRASIAAGSMDDIWLADSHCSKPSDTSINKALRDEWSTISRRYSRKCWRSNGQRRLGDLSSREAEH
jgi:hypothetical protein